VAPAQHPRLPFHWKRTPSRLGRKQESQQDFLYLRIYPKPVPRDLPQDFSNFRNRIPVGFYPWSRSDLGPAYARIAEASTSFPVPREGPDSGRRVSPSAVSDPSRRARSGVHHPAPLCRGRFVSGPRAPWTPAQGGLCHTTPLGGCYVSGHDPSPAYAGGRVTPERGFPPHSRAAAEAGARRRGRHPPSGPAAARPVGGSGGDAATAGVAAGRRRGPPPMGVVATPRLAGAAGGDSARTGGAPARTCGPPPASSLRTATKGARAEVRVGGSIGGAVFFFLFCAYNPYPVSCLFFIPLERSVSHRS